MCLRRFMSPENMSKAARCVALAGLVLVLVMAPLRWTPRCNAQTAPAFTHISHRHSHSDLLDVNTATAEQLQSVPGITELYAKRILAGRPYTTKRQLLTKGILPSAVYDQVKTHLIAHRKKKQ